MDGWCVCGVNWSREWGDGLGGYDVPGGGNRWVWVGSRRVWVGSRWVR